MEKPFHDPVMKKEILEHLLSQSTRSVFDGTLGLGGHAEAILEHFPDLECYMGCDLDLQHLGLASARLTPWHSRLRLHEGNFSELGEVLQKEKPSHPLAVLLDLGLCSNQVDDASKGFSYNQEGPLHMNFSENGETAESVLNSYSEKDLKRIFQEYGEEKASGKIARMIVESRKQAPLRTTFDLRRVVAQGVPARFLTDALKRVFQAVRMEVNQELPHLRQALESALEVLGKGDRIGVITYHSLEDRLVKQCFAQATSPLTRESLYSLHEEIAPASWKSLFKKPLEPSLQEVQSNPRARSAKLRIIEKIA